jgi:hypothetical protein
MIRRLFTVLFAVVGLMAIGGPALAAPPQTDTNVAKNVVESFPDVVPSCGDAGDPTHLITTTSNSVEHETTFADGRVHATFTQTGTFVAEPLDAESGLPSYTGRFTTWGGFNDSGKTVNGTFTFTVHGTGSDGSTFAVHSTDHFATTPTGAEFSFTHCHD